MGAKQYLDYQHLGWIIPGSLVKPGACEPLKAAKEHATECHHNPNYAITFELSWLLSVCHVHMVSNNEIVVSLCGN